MSLCLAVAAATILGPKPSPDNQGWVKYLEDEIDEYHDLPLSWSLNTTVPDWIKGSYIKIGPARKTFGDDRYYGNYLDSYGKIHKFTFNGAEVKFSGRMVETPNYNKSVTANQMAPTVTLGKVYPNDWTLTELLEVASNVYDNTNVLVVRLGPEDKEKAQYIAATDYPTVSEIDIDTLAFKSKLSLSIWSDGVSGASCAHWRREIGKDTSINYHVILNLLTNSTFKLYRFKNNWEEREVIGSFDMPHGSMIHSFGLSVNFAIIVLFPVTIDMSKVPTVNMHILEALKLLEGESTKIYLIDLRDGSVIDGFTSNDPALVYGVHHINAWEEDNEVVFDFTTSAFDVLKTYMDLNEMLTHVDTNETKAATRVKRVRLDKTTKDVTVEEWPNKLKVPLLNTLEFPVINFDYAGRKNCFVYGWVAMDYWRNVLVKKDLCDSRNDKTWSKPSHYPGEMWFIPRPGAVDEDDGVLLTIVFDGTIGQSYLMVMDARTFQELNHSYLPHNVPLSFHGNWFPELH